MFLCSVFQQVKNLCSLNISANYTSRRGSRKRGFAAVSHVATFVYNTKPSVIYPRYCATVSWVTYQYAWENFSIRERRACFCNPARSVVCKMSRGYAKLASGGFASSSLSRRFLQISSSRAALLAPSPFPRVPLIRQSRSYRRMNHAGERARLRNIR